MKEDYSKYSYSKTLDRLENSYLHGSDKTNYAKYLLNMNDQTTIEALMVIYNKMFNVLPSFVYIGNSIPDYWYVFECWAGQSSYMALDVNKCLNENIFRIYTSEAYPTDEFAYKCLANLRCCDNVDNIHQQIVEKRHSLDETVLEQISNTRKGVFQLRYDAFEYEAGSNGMKMIESRYLDCKKLLLQYGYIESVLEKEFEKAKGIYAPSFPGEEKKIKTISYIIFAVIFVALIALVIFIGSNFLSIIIFIGACFALPKLIKG